MCLGCGSIDGTKYSSGGGRARGAATYLQSAAYYALTDEELEEILDTEDAALRLFLKGLCTAQCRLIKYVVPVAARDEFENGVFRPASKSAVIQKHLGLEMAQSIFDQ